jgi:hypothetical protein
MGTGKSSAAITFMNEHPDQRFIYITPYLDEARRIAEACPALQFREPRRMPEYHGSKVLHTADLVHDGYNVSTTHNAFISYTPEMLEDIQRLGYTLIVDECVSVLQSEDVDPEDLRILIDAGRIEADDDGSYRVAGEVPPSGAYAQLMRTLKDRKFYNIPGMNGESLFYWMLPEDLLLAFRDVYILTYLFEGQDLRYYLDMQHIPYSYAGVTRRGGEYRFCDGRSYVPEYARHLREHIHILDKPKLNTIGEPRTALSMKWHQGNEAGVEQLKRNLNNYFRQITGGDSACRMWGGYACSEWKLRGKGYTNGFVPFNERATNKYRDKNVLAYCANVFMNTGQKLFYTKRGVDVDEDTYALSVMVQWIWRSAIRDGKDIQLYLPSKRMRTMLIDWMDHLAEHK